MNKVKPFRYWCQTVLPTVYDDSLSYYELLCKVIFHLNEMGDIINQTNNNFAELKNYVENYFNNTDFQNMVNEKLDEMAESGVLDSLINNNTYLFANRDTYKADTLKIIADYLVRDVNSNCIIGSPVSVDVKVAYCYSLTKGYENLFSRPVRSYVGDDTVAISGVNYPVVYSDCSNFLSLITKGIKFTDSVYWLSINGIDLGIDNYSDMPALSKAIENPNYDWTFDFLNNIQTGFMAQLMDGSGNPLQEFAGSDGTSITYNPAWVNCKTGDILFRGSSSSTSYKGIGHCGYYIKTLDELNEAASAYGVRFKTYNNEVSEYGYIVDVVQGTDTYTDVLRICTIEKWFSVASSDSYIKIFFCKPRTNANISNKIRGRRTRDLLYLARRYTLDNGFNPIGCFETDANTAFLRGLSLTGVSFSTGQDINTSEKGVFKTNTGAVISSLVNTPFPVSGGAVTLINIGGFVESGATNLQIFIHTTTAEMRIAVRQKIVSTYQSWRMVGLT